MTKPEKKLQPVDVEPSIVTVRGQKVILDADLAMLYGVPTKRLNEQMKRNRDRFPEDFVFQLTAQEAANLKSQIATSSLQTIDNKGDESNRSQIATSSDRSRSQIATLKSDVSMWSQIATTSTHGGGRKRPYAFTEHGAIMAASVLNSPQAVEMSVFIVRAFVKMREHLATTRELAKRLAEIERQLIIHDGALGDLYDRIRPLLLPPEDPPTKPIGFGVREARARYGSVMKKVK
jgi:hypothetical protein